MKSEDIDAKAIKSCVTAIRQAAEFKAAVRLFIAFCERYRKNYAARRKRLKYLPSKTKRSYQKWWDANKEAYNDVRKDRYRKKIEKEWRDGRRKKKPQWLR